MPPSKDAAALPGKLRYKLLIAFCLMSMLPILIGVYIASLFIRFPFEASAGNLTVVSLVIGASIFLSLLGYQLTRQLVRPIIQVAAATRQIAAGKLDISMEFKGAEELEELERSLKTITLNARELLERVESLSQKDKLTGLYNASYIKERLDEEIQRAKHFQRPCSFALLRIANADSYAAARGSAAWEAALKSIAEVFRRHLAEFDRAARLRANEFALIFPDKNKKKTIDIVIRIKAEISASAFAQDDETAGLPGLALYIGLSENPLDGMSGEELFAKAGERAALACRKGDHFIEAFA